MNKDIKKYYMDEIASALCTARAKMEELKDDYEDELSEDVLDFLEDYTTVINNAESECDELCDNSEWEE